MEQILIDMYGSLAMFGIITIGCGLIGGATVSFNGHTGEGIVEHLLCILQGAVAAMVVSLIIMPLTSFLSMQIEVTLIILVTASIVADKVIVYIKENGLDWITGKITSVFKRG